MMNRLLNIVFIGLSISSSWGNGHAGTYRALIRALARRGHRIMFLEREVPWYAANRDLSQTDYCDIRLYSSFLDLRTRFTEPVRDADVAILGSYVPEGITVGDWMIRTARGVTAFYDIDTPVTMASLERGQCDYLSPGLLERFDVYFSFTGGPFLEHIQRHYRIPAVKALYCSADPEVYQPIAMQPEFDLGYLGTYSPDRQPALEKLLIEAARHWPTGRFVVAGSQYPRLTPWPVNIHRFEHIPPQAHREFYCSQRTTLNLTRADMIAAGYSPSVRLFEAAACGTPVISDHWAGLESVFEPGVEILISRSAGETLQYLQNLNEERLRTIGDKARRRFLGAHTPDHRAAEFEQQVVELLSRPRNRQAG
jgi:spore maturation protein CgeB